MLTIRPGEGIKEYMSRYPEPPTGKMHGQDAGMVRTLDGHIGINVYTDPDFASDIALRRNERVGDELDLGGRYDTDSSYDHFEEDA